MTPGVYDLSSDQYHADELGDTPTLSASLANVLLQQSPMHAWAAHPKLNPDFEKKAEDKFDLGRIVHSLLLEGLDVMDVLAFPDYKTNAAKEAKALARSHGRIPILGHQAHAVTQMVNAVAQQLGTLNIDPVPLTAGKPEQTIAWTDHGVHCRARLDWLTDDHAQIHDVKTTSRIGHPDGWARGALYDHGYDLQAAAYIRAVKAITGTIPEFRWILIETAPPFAVSVIAPTAAVLAIGDAKFDKALETWKRCLENDDWPAYGRELHWAELPEYIESRWLAREAREEAIAA
jgi:hypothetical protein